MVELDAPRVTSWSSEIEERSHPLAEELELLDRLADGPQEHALDARLGVAREPLRTLLRRPDEKPVTDLLGRPPERRGHPLVEDATGADRIVLDPEHHRGERVREGLRVLAVEGELLRSRAHESTNPSGLVL